MGEILLVIWGIEVVSLKGRFHGPTKYADETEKLADKLGAT